MLQRWAMLLGRRNLGIRASYMELYESSPNPASDACWRAAEAVVQNFPCQFRCRRELFRCDGAWDARATDCFDAIYLAWAVKFEKFPCRLRNLVSKPPFLCDPAAASGVDRNEAI
jgi:hypothetical protein